MGKPYKFDRVLLKVSGEALMGDQSYGIDVSTTDRIAGEVIAAHKNGLQIALGYRRGQYIPRIFRQLPPELNDQRLIIWACSPPS